VGGGHKVHGRAATRAGKERQGRVGYAYLHSAVDDFSRLAYTEVLADEKGCTAAAFWRRAEAWFRAHGVIVERVLTDNGFCYRGRLFNEALAATGDTAGAAPTDHRPMGKSNGSIALSSRNGRTSGRTRAKPSEPGLLRTGFIATTITGGTPQSEVRLSHA